MVARAMLLSGLLAALPAPAQARQARDVAAKEQTARAKSRTSGGARTSVIPYLEVSQAVFAELSPGSDVLTYTNLAAGVDAQIAGRNNQGAVSLRYERRIGWGKGDPDGDVVSGLARVASQIVPGRLRIDAGALAARTRIDGSGGASLNPLVSAGDSSSQIYSFYAGPTLTTHAGDVALAASYRAGYTRVEDPKGFRPAPGIPAVDIVDDTLSQIATVSAGFHPGDILPLGVTASSGWAREDISNLDQRIDQKYGRLDFVLPISLDVALVAGVGYEDVEISSRDVLRDVNGLPVVGRNGRLRPDKSAPRQLAYDVDGLIYDAGVMWRPSRRTALEAHVGKRYGSTSVYGSFAYAPDARSSLNVSVYDNVFGFGGTVRRALEDLSTDFETSRNPLTGDLNGCVITRANGTCLNSALSSVAAATFRARGVTVSYNLTLGRISAGIGVGYDRRKFIAAPGTVLAVANGVIDENAFFAGYLGARLDQRSSLSANVYANWFQSGLSAAGDATALGANAAYFRNLTDRLGATAAVGIDGIEREEPFIDQWGASALVGLRYTL
ncbi:preprotein translocase subunit YajC [Novosphingobium sp. Gsoil 351]|nr:preprotein translocase subunit YajC [Novosphingobium sp. Gsoil 351]